MQHRIGFLHSLGYQQAAVTHPRYKDYWMRSLYSLCLQWRGTEGYLRRPPIVRGITKTYSNQVLLCDFYSKPQWPSPAHAIIGIICKGRTGVFLDLNTTPFPGHEWDVPPRGACVTQQRQHFNPEQWTTTQLPSQTSSGATVTKARVTFSPYFADMGLKDESLGHAYRDVLNLQFPPQTEAWRSLSETQVQSSYFINKEDEAQKNTVSGPRSHS